MRCRVAVTYRLIMTSSDNLSLLVDNDGSHRNFAGRLGQTGFLQREIHIVFVQTGLHGRMLN